MFQNEKILISFREEYINISNVLRALNDTLLFLV